MWYFLDKLLNVALPRIRDFRGVSPEGFDGRGNYSLGLREQVVFPEVDYDKIDKLRGLEVSIVTTARTDDEARSLLDAGSECHFARGREEFGQEIIARALEAGPCAPEVQGPFPQPVSPLRAPARFPSQVRHVPHLLPQTWPPRDASPA